MLEVTTEEGGGGGHGGGGRHSQHHTHRKSSGNCYSSTNRNDIRLWNGTAPGAIGKDPCLDVPFLRKFPAKEASKLVEKIPLQYCSYPAAVMAG
ncbi:hypothetical protein BV898_04168 [Hypsibius exemplaris]|uniref:Uncharacterized protein n=1 Tax=Hypsibius exemplaris TaxID=2072580 RepID=A0A1W0X332_HYPEX|nr:hypothetical protein BV898_04168 [Hypsibius exemplaris]